MVQIHFVEVDSFLDFARFVCAFREYPLRVYAHKLNNKMILSCRLVLSNSILAFYTDYENGRYIEYDPKGGKETAKVVNSIIKILQKNLKQIQNFQSIGFREFS